MKMNGNLRQRIAELSPEARTRLETQLLENVKAKPRIRRQKKTADSYPLSFGQERLFFLHQMEPESPAYNQPKALRVDGDLNLAVMKRVLETIVARHEVLRSTFHLRDGALVQRPEQNYAVELSVFDLSSWPSEQRAVEAQRRMKSISRRPFNLATDSMLRAALLRLHPTEHLLLLVTHHIVSDAWARDILFHEIATLYESFSSENVSPLPDLPAQYGDFALGSVSRLMTPF